MDRRRREKNYSKSSNKGLNPVCVRYTGGHMVELITVQSKQNNGKH